MRQPYLEDEKQPLDLRMSEAYELKRYTGGGYD